MTYNVISGDCHIDLGWLPADLFLGNVPSKWKDKMPKVLETNGRRVWQADGVSLSAVAGLGFTGREKPNLGIAKHVDRMFETGLYGDQGSYVQRRPISASKIKN
jgi:hypothetical protein